MSEDLVVGVAVRVDESRREHEALRVDDLLAAPPGEPADVRDPVADDAHVGDDGGTAGTIEHARAGDQDRLRVGGDGREREGENGEGAHHTIDYYPSPNVNRPQTTNGVPRTA